MYRRRRHGGGVSYEQKTELTPKEIVILRLLAEGCASREIGTRLFISYETVRTHVAQLRLKLGARNRAHAVSLGYIQGLLTTTSTDA